MPIPTCECSVCHQVVNKAQTYAIGDGKRACKSHQGVVEQAQALQDKAKADKEAAEERKRRAEAQRRQEREERFQPDPGIAHWRDFECWTCGREALPLQVYFSRQLIALEKQKLRGGNEYVKAMLGDQQAHEQNLKDMGFPVGTIFYRELPLPDIETDRAKRERIIHDIKGRSRQAAVAIIGVVHLCANCCKKYGLEFFPPPPKINLTTMALLGSMSTPNLTAIAQKELDAEKEKTDG